MIITGISTLFRIYICFTFLPKVTEEGKINFSERLKPPDTSILLIEYISRLFYKVVVNIFVSINFKPISSDQLFYN